MIEGDVVCRCRDGLSEITIADSRGVRSLYFGDGVMQSCLQLGRPSALLMDYSQAMMTALVFRRRPESILLIGLGGGSLLHFLLQACPASSIDVVEISGEVIRLAQEYFYVPPEGGRVAIFRSAGEDFIRETDRRYDLILVDAFDEAGPAGPLLGEMFLSACRLRLQENGVFAMNVWNRLCDNFPVMCGTAGTAFGGGTLKLLLGEVHRNAIIFGFENPSLVSDVAAYRPEAARLQRESNINFPRFLKHLYWQNFCS